MVARWNVNVAMSAPDVADSSKLDAKAIMDHVSFMDHVSSLSVQEQNLLKGKEDFSY